MKYIMLRFPIDKAKTHFREAPIIFPDSILHVVMYHATCRLFGNETDVMSAGMIDFDLVECKGESESLGLKAEDGDSLKILGFL
jgi:hypothetical protein